MPSQTAQSRGPSLAFLSLLIAGVGVVFALHGFLSASEAFAAAPMRPSTWRLLLGGALPWLPWIVGAPLVALLAMRWRVARGALIRSLLLHLVAAGILSALITWGSRAWFEANAPTLPTLGATEFKLPPGVVVPEGWPDGDAGAASQMGPPIALAPRFEFPITTVFFSNFLSYAMFVLLSQALLFYADLGRSREKAAALQTDLSKARLHVLESRLNPHFLFNSLNSIVGVAESAPAIARKMLVQLSGLLRSSMNEAAASELSLEEELRFTRAFVDLAKLRFEDRLDVSWDVGPETLDCLVPIWSVQTLIENCVVHAVERVTRPVHVCLLTQLEDGALKVTVEDDGPGTEELPEGLERTGLGNLRTRLGQLYGAEASLVVSSGRAGGYRAEFVVPERSSARTN